NLCHVKLAIVKREAMRRIQIVEHRHRARRLSGMFGIRKGEHFAVAHVCDKQHAARTERQHPRTRRGPEHRDVNTFWQLQPRESELFGVRARYYKQGSNRTYHVWRT